MNILVIEDERPAAKRIIQLLNDKVPEAKIFGHLDSIEAAVHWLSYNPSPDLIISDIELADGQSFEIFQQIDVKSPIIFTTAYDQFAIKAFKHNSVDYLLKPIDPKELATALDKFKNLSKPDSVNLSVLQKMINDQQQHYKERFMVKVREKIYTVLTPSIRFFYSSEKATFIQTQEKKKFLVDYTLDQLEETLDPKAFFRLNRKYIASLEAIDEIVTYSNSRLKIKLKDCDNNALLVSREKVTSFKIWLDS